MLDCHSKSPKRAPFAGRGNRPFSGERNLAGIGTGPGGTSWASSLESAVQQRHERDSRPGSAPQRSVAQRRGLAERAEGTRDRTWLSGWRLRERCSRLHPVGRMTMLVGFSAILTLSSSRHARALILSPPADWARPLAEVTAECHVDHTFRTATNKCRTSGASPGFRDAEPRSSARRADSSI